MVPKRNAAELVLVLHFLVGGCLLGDSVAKLSTDVLQRTVFVIMSQIGNDQTAQESRNLLIKELKDAGLDLPHVVLLHEDLPTHGAWTFFPILQPLIKNYGDTVDWFCFLDEAASVSPSVFAKVMEKYDLKHHAFIGKALKDRGSTVIHHFEDSGLNYPHLASGFVLSRILISDLATVLYENSFDVKGFPTDFSIDASYELSKVIFSLYGNTDKLVEGGVKLLDEKAFCGRDRKASCAVWRRRDATANCKPKVEEIKAVLDSTLYAVKTCRNHRDTRLPIIKKTWGYGAPHVMYFSEETDSEFGTVRLPGVNNTEKGHCGKTEAILKYFRDNHRRKDWEWLVIADDDTLISVGSLSELLYCYDPDKPIAIGERYGFRIASGKYGYDYPTGGAGMVFSHKAVWDLLKEGGAHCKCREPDSPDDMHLGACLSNIGLALIHSSRLHQARSEDYSPEILDDQDPVSFHKFWEIDPMAVYNKWFQKDDEKLLGIMVPTKHEEL